MWSVFYSIALTKQNFTLKYDTNIPRQVVRLSSSFLNMIFKTIHKASNTLRTYNCFFLFYNKGPCWKQVGSFFPTTLATSDFTLHSQRWKWIRLFTFLLCYSAIVSATLKCLMKFYNITDNVGSLCLRPSLSFTVNTVKFTAFFSSLILPLGSSKTNPGQLHPQRGEWWTLHHRWSAGQSRAGQQYFNCLAHLQVSLNHLPLCSFVVEGLWGLGLHGLQPEAHGGAGLR